MIVLPKETAHHYPPSSPKLANLLPVNGQFSLLTVMRGCRPKCSSQSAIAAHILSPETQREVQCLKRTAMHKAAARKCSAAGKMRAIFGEAVIHAAPYAFGRYVRKAPVLRCYVAVAVRRQRMQMRKRLITAAVRRLW